jgi:hypothetical protein
MSSSHDFHCNKPFVEAKWSSGPNHNCAVFENGDWHIAIYARDDMVDRLKRATEAFNREMQREPVEQAAE